MKYIIEEAELRELLYSYYKLEALEYGGVDNWEWYGESQEDYLSYVFGTANIHYIDNEDGFEHLVNEDIKKYKPFDYMEKIK